MLWDSKLTKLRLQPPTIFRSGPHSQQHRPPPPLPILKHIRMPRPLHLLARPIVPQRRPLALPRPEHPPFAPEHPLLVARLGPALRREEVVPPAALDDVRALCNAVRGRTNHSRRGEAAAGGEVDLGDVDCEVLVRGVRGPLGEARCGGEVDLAVVVVVPEELGLLEDKCGGGEFVACCCSLTS